MERGIKIIDLDGVEQGFTMSQSDWFKYLDFTRNTFNDDKSLTLTIKKL